MNIFSFYLFIFKIGEISHSISFQLQSLIFIPSILNIFMSYNFDPIVVKMEVISP